MERFHSAAISAFCSLMLGSAFMGSQAGPRLAGVALLAAGAVAGEVKTLSASGWEAVSEVQVANALAAVPDAAPSSPIALKSVDSGMAAVRDAVLKSDVEGSLPGFLCTLLGLTQNNEALQVKQKSSKEGDLIQVANVSMKTREDMIIGHRTADSAVLYRTDSSGVLIKAASFKKGQGGTEIPVADAQAGFEAARAYWIARLGGAVASAP